MQLCSACAFQLKCLASDDLKLKFLFRSKGCLHVLEGGDACCRAVGADATPLLSMHAMLCCAVLWVSTFLAVQCLFRGSLGCVAGHANMSAVLCTYTAGYFLWTIYMRHRESVFGAFDERRGWARFLWKDFCHAIAMYWILLMVRPRHRACYIVKPALCPAWYAFWVLKVHTPAPCVLRAIVLAQNTSLMGGAQGVVSCCLRPWLEVSKRKPACLRGFVPDLRQTFTMRAGSCAAGAVMGHSRLAHRGQQAQPLRCGGWLLLGRLCGCRHAPALHTMLEVSLNTAQLSPLLQA